VSGIKYKKNSIKLISICSIIILIISNYFLLTVLELYGFETRDFIINNNYKLLVDSFFTKLVILSLRVFEYKLVYFIFLVFPIIIGMLCIFNFKKQTKVFLLIYISCHILFSLFLSYITIVHYSMKIKI
jgi:hypothetical protein